MNKLASRIKPKSGFSHFLHLGLTALLPALVYVFVQMGFNNLALAVILLSKWRMLAVRPRHWWPNIRANAVDIIVGVSILIFMINATTDVWLLFWAATYGIWLIFIKPGSSSWMISLQALIGQACGLMALFLGWPDAPLGGLVALGWLICYSSARHFFSSFDEPYTSLMAHAWGYFAAALIWVLGHWLLFYGVVSQPTLLLTVIGYGLATLYYLDHTDRLSSLVRKQFIFIMVAIVVIVLVFSDWGDKSV